MIRVSEFTKGDFRLKSPLSLGLYVSRHDCCKSNALQSEEIPINQWNTRAPFDRSLTPTRKFRQPARLTRGIAEKFLPGSRFEMSTTPSHSTPISVQPRSAWTCPRHVCALRECLSPTHAMSIELIIDCSVEDMNRGKMCAASSSMIRFAAKMQLCLHQRTPMIVHFIIRYGNLK